MPISATMFCIAALVRVRNASMFEDHDPPLTGPESLDGPAPLDSGALPDGRTWVVVYADGSSLDDRGIVRAHAPNAARVLREHLPHAA